MWANKYAHSLRRWRLHTCLLHTCVMHTCVVLQASNICAVLTCVFDQFILLSLKYVQTKATQSVSQGEGQVLSGHRLLSHTGASHVSPMYTQCTNTGIHKHKYRNTQYTNTGIHKHKYRNAQKQENTKTKIHSTNTRTIRNAHEVTHRGQPCVTNMYTHNTQSTNTGIQKIKHITCVLASWVLHT